MSVKANSYFKIEAFMVNDLHLKGNALLVYAIIHSFSKGDSWFTGGLSYLSEWTGLTKQGLMPIIKNLTTNDLIVSEQENRGCVKRYKTTSTMKETLIPTMKETLTHHERNFNTTMKETLTHHERNFHDIYIDNNKNTYIHNSYGRTEFCFNILKTIAVNTNQLHDPQTQTAFYDATLQLQDDDHKQTADEIVWLWNSLQIELKQQGRAPMYMPNALKWLTNDAVAKVKQARGGKHYSVSRAVSTVDRLAQKLGMTDE